MYKLLGIVSLLVTSSLGVPTLDGRVVGGQDADIENYPYQLSFEANGMHNCGATIISHLWAVSAAHCVQGRQMNTLRFRAGSSIRQVGGSLHPVEQLIVHPQYDAKSSFDYDIVLAKVSEPFVYGPGVQPIPLATEDPAANAVAVVTGWGFTIPFTISFATQLQSLHVPIVNREQCQGIYGETITKTMICAGHEVGKAICQSDSGGPLVVAGKFVGVVAFSASACGENGKPDVYADIPAFREFITSNTDVE